MYMGHVRRAIPSARTVTSAEEVARICRGLEPSYAFARVKRLVLCSYISYIWRERCNRIYAGVTRRVDAALDLIWNETLTLSTIRRCLPDDFRRLRLLPDV
ncbi:hypothetical protein LINGRAHAP2_LOCUS24242 [Linum grandiflorum]